MRSASPVFWSARVTYVYPSMFASTEGSPASFDYPGGLRLESGGRGATRVSREYTGHFPAFDAQRAFGMGGWGLDVVHRYDPLSRILFYGDGSRRQWGQGPEARQGLVRVAGTFAEGGGGEDGDPAREVPLHSPRGVSSTKTGELLIADAGNCRVRKVRRDGTIVTIAGRGCDPAEEAPLGDGLPAVDALLGDVRKAVEGQDGAVYIADGKHGRIRRVDQNGLISTFANFNVGTCKARVHDVDVDATGLAYAVTENRTADLGWDGAPRCAGVMRISPGGAWERMWDPVGIVGLSGIDVLADGTVVYAKSSCVTELGLNWWNQPRILPESSVGYCYAYVSMGTSSPAGPTDFDRGDGELGGFLATRFYGPSHVAVARDRTVYVADTINRRVRAIGPDGIVRTVVGGGSTYALADGLSPAEVALQWPTGVAIAADGETLYVADARAHVVWKVGPVQPEFAIPSPDGSVLDVFDEDGLHLRTEDGLSRRVLRSFTYGEYPGLEPTSPPRKLVREVRDSYGNVVTIARGPSGAATSITGPFGHVTTLATDGSTGYLSEVEWSDGSGSARVALAHRPTGLLESLRDPNGGLYRFSYDDSGRLAGVSDAANGTLSLVPGAETKSGREVTQRTGLGRTSNVGLEILSKREIRRTWTSSAGLTSSSLEVRDGSVAGTAADGSSLSMATGPDPVHGNLVRLPIEATTMLPSGRSVSISRTTQGLATDPSDALRTLQRTEAVTVNGRTSKVAFDGWSRTVMSTSPMGRSVTTHLDTFGQPVRVTAAGVPDLRYAYDARGRLERVEQGSGAEVRVASYTYAPSSGYLASTTDVLGRTTGFERDGVGRVTKQILPDLREIAFSYDANGNLTSVTPPTRPAHVFGYTPVDQVETYTPPEAGFAPRHTTYAYNSDGQVTTVTRPDGQQIVFSYEPNGRPDLVTLPTGVVDVAYDAVSGWVSGVSAAGGVDTTFSYDGPLVTAMTTTGPAPGTVGFTYDADLRLASRTLAGGPAVAFGYDADGLLTHAGDLTLTRDAASGRLESTTLGTTSDSRTRTSFAELDVYTATIGATTAYAYDLDRDVAGRITKKVETIGGVTAVWEYAYHPERGWLTEVKKDGVVVATYAYDANGNRTSWSDFWGSGSASYDAQDRQLTAGGASFTYTPNGERLTKVEGPETTTTVYDVRGSLLAVELPNGIEITYLLDAEGRRIGKKVAGVLTRGWLYAGGLSPVAELDGTGAITATYVYATKVSVPDVILRGGSSYRVFTDHLGSVRLVVDAMTGGIVQRLDYDAFGRITYDSNPGWQPFGFAGGLYDPQTGLTRFGARDYEAASGRWTAKDPIGFAGGSTGLYTYVENDPVNLVDPDGRHPLLIAAVGLVGLGYAIHIYREEGPEQAEQFLRYELPEAVSIAALSEVLGGFVEGGYNRAAALGRRLSRTINISTVGKSVDEAAAIRTYASRTNQWLEANGPQRIRSTAGTLRGQANAAARAERLRAARAGQPYLGQVGHVPDTAITGAANPPAGWLDMPGVSNNACGGVLGCRVGRTFDAFTVDGVLPPL